MLQEFGHPPLRIVERAKRVPARHEPHVSTGRGELHLETVITRGNTPDLMQHITRKERIINSVEEQRPHTNIRKESNRARTSVIVVRIAEAVNWSSHRVVEVIQRACRLDALARNELRIAFELRQG